MGLHKNKPIRNPLVFDMAIMSPWEYRTLVTHLKGTLIEPEFTIYYDLFGKADRLEVRHKGSIVP